MPRRRSSPRPCWSPRLRWIGTLSCAADTPCCAARRQQACSSPKFRAAASSFGRQVGTASPSRGEAATEHADGECPPTPKCPACTRSPSAGAGPSSPSGLPNAFAVQRASLVVHPRTAPHRVATWKRLGGFSIMTTLPHHRCRRRHCCRCRCRCRRRRRRRRQRLYLRQRLSSPVITGGWTGHPHPALSPPADHTS